MDHIAALKAGVFLPATQGLANTPRHIQSCRSVLNRLRAVLAIAVCLFVPQAFAQANDTMTAIAIPEQPNAIEIGTGPLPDAKNKEAWHSQYGSQFARNVTVATLTPFLPDPDKASGAA